MLPFQVMTANSSNVIVMRPTAKKLTRSQLDTLERIAFDVFEQAYTGQYGRIKNAIQRAAPDTLAAFDSSDIWELEPELVEKAVRKWYEDNAVRIGRDTFDTIDLDTDWRDVNKTLLETSKARAGWFARAMTETSMEQSQEVITKWLDTEGGTIGDLVDSMQGVWTGPRPQTAALTETTNLVSQSETAVGIAAGYWGYGVVTRNDSSVRPAHAEAASNGPWPMSDTEHKPPVNGDYNCRCQMYLVREAPV